MRILLEHLTIRRAGLLIVLLTFGFLALEALSVGSLSSKPCTAPGTTQWGLLADDVYHLGLTEPSLYYGSLRNFTNVFPSSSPLKTSLLHSVDTYSSHPNSSLSFPSMVDNRLIFQTDKESKGTEATRSWTLKNQKWEYRFLDDAAAETWVKVWFDGTEIAHAWKVMKAGVLKADFLRYLLMLVHGGVYSDTDTVALRPIEQWGKLHPRLYTNGSLSSFDYSPDSEPSLILGIEVDVWKPGCGWIKKWPRPLQIAQWTLSSTPHHPIYLDAARRVSSTARKMEAWEKSRDEEVKLLEGLGDEASLRKAYELNKKLWTNMVSTLEWTGPAMFTDAVLAYLETQYDVTWPSLKSLTEPLRIGEILILPLAGFSPNADSDLRWSRPSSPQSSVLHLFRGSWKNMGKWKAFKRWLANRGGFIFALGMIITLFGMAIWIRLRMTEQQRTRASVVGDESVTDGYELVWDAQNDSFEEDQNAKNLWRVGN
ncbi:OCH1 [Phaffia rhodozyma]|uniref:OCH1 n=1 Tax=Phaffia rhodozyma TaxID=264483 RepID=A0A0F7SMI7_PHARH|nr:OCH1 [Phaffia rhodozyma]